jgi:hypothetical protein
VVERSHRAWQRADALREAIEVLEEDYLQHAREGWEGDVLPMLRAE